MIYFAKLSQKRFCRMSPALPTAQSTYGLNASSPDSTADFLPPAGLHLSRWKFAPNNLGWVSILVNGSLNIFVKNITKLNRLMER